MMSDFLALTEVRAGYSDYMGTLNERGVTAIKEMAFDDYYGFADEMARREESGELTVRVSMMSQPVGAGANLSYAREARERFRVRSFVFWLQPYDRSRRMGGACRDD